MSGTIIKDWNDIVLAGSDIISFHNYGNKEQLENEIKELKKHNRPLINTEWMNRQNGSTIATNLEVFYKEKVGCMLWGLINGKTQTDLPWGHRPGDPISNVWQHDLFHGDFKLYDPIEIATIKIMQVRRMGMRLRKIRITSIAPSYRQFLAAYTFKRMVVY